MKFIKINKKGDTRPIYLNVDKIVYIDTEKNIEGFHYVYLSGTYFYVDETNYRKIMSAISQI